MALRKFTLQVPRRRPPPKLLRPSSLYKFLFRRFSVQVLHSRFCAQAVCAACCLSEGVRLVPPHRLNSMLNFSSTFLVRAFSCKLARVQFVACSLVPLVLHMLSCFLLSTCSSRVLLRILLSGSSHASCSVRPFVHVAARWGE